MPPGVPDFDADVAAISPFTIGASIGVEFVAGEDGQARLERKIRQRASAEPNGKLSKTSAYYIPTSTPPFVWEYECDTCRFYNATSENGGTCDVVGRDEDPMGGEAVHPDAWCALWLPKEDDAPFEWVRNRLNPDG